MDVLIGRPQAVSIFLLLTFLTEEFHGFTLPRPSEKNDEDLTEAMMYLMKYGYMDLNGKDPKKSSSLVSTSGLAAYIEEFQAFSNLTVTGELDEETLAMMKRPRCGVKDVVGHGSSREKRYALQGSRWKVRDLTYRISRYPTKGLSKKEVDKEIAKALKVWSDVTDLKFRQKDSGPVHIDINFASRDHGDGDPFDGEGGTLAHAFFPVFGGDAHFDDSETWTINSYKGTNLLQTAAHEFGHSLGLSHSDQYRALMAPFYRGYETRIRLDRDDVTAIQALYGRKSEKRAQTPAKRPDSKVDKEVEELCQNSTIDSILTTKEGTFTFKGDQYWKLTKDSIAPGYPKSVSKFWDGMPPGIDASFTWTNGKSYFFKGDKYWRFTEGKMDRDYPKPISKGFDGVPNNLDAAFVWSGNGKIYFFKGKQYWRFDPEKRPPVKKDYPRPISNWEGVPDFIDDAIQYTNGYTYFFKKGLYYRFDDRSFQVDTSASPPFPRPAGYWWFGCTSQPREGRPQELRELPSDDLEDVSNETLDSESVG